MLHSFAVRTGVGGLSLRMFHLFLGFAFTVVQNTVNCQTCFALMVPHLPKSGVGENSDSLTRLLGLKNCTLIWFRYSKLIPKSTSSARRLILLTQKRTPDKYHQAESDFGAPIAAGFDGVHHHRVQQGTSGGRGFADGLQLNCFRLHSSNWFSGSAFFSRRFAQLPGFNRRGCAAFYSPSK